MNGNTKALLAKTFADSPTMKNRVVGGSPPTIKLEKSREEKVRLD